MKEQLELIRQDALAALAAADSMAALDEIRVKWLGKKGELTAVLKTTTYPRTKSHLRPSPQDTLPKGALSYPNCHSLRFVRYENELPLSRERSSHPFRFPHREHAYNDK